MGYDLVTWAPRLGASGDDKYNLDGGTTLAGTVDPGNPTRRDGGSSSYSSTPTIPEINAGSHVNQVIALYNRRQAQMNALRGGTPTPMAYIAPDQKINASAMLAIYTAIGNLRTAEGFSTYTFPTSEVAAAKYPLAKHLAHARKALAIAGVQTIVLSNLTGAYYRQRDEKPYGTVQATNIYKNSIYVSTYGGRGVLQSGANDVFFSGLTTGYVRIRMLVPLPIYNFVDPAEIVSAKIEIVTTTAAQSGGVGEMGITSGTQLTTIAVPASADFDLNFTSSVVFSSTGTHSLSLAPSEFAVPGVRQILTYEQHEKAGDSTALVGAAQVIPRTPTANAAITLTVDWG